MRWWRLVKEKEFEPVPLTRGPLSLLESPHSRLYTSEEWELQKAMIIESHLEFPPACSWPACPLNCLQLTEVFQFQSLLLASLTTGVWASFVLRESWLSPLASKIHYYIEQKHLAGTWDLRLQSLPSSMQSTSKLHPNCPRHYLSTSPSMKNVEWRT